MRLWQKISVCSLSFFLVVFLASGIFMIENNKKTAFDRILQQATAEQTGISSGILRYVMMSRMQELREDGFADKKYITDYLDSRINSRGIYLEIREGEDVLYSNLNFELPAPGDDSGGVTEYRLQDIEGKRYLVLTSGIRLPDKVFINTHLTDISGIYVDRASQYSFFIKLCVIVSVILTAGMYILTRHLTKSLRILTESAQKIAEGNYREQVEIHAKDETGMLADSYNKMAKAIEETIGELENKAKQQQRFIDNFTHELRTPLTAVVGYADLLRSTHCTENEAQELGERIFKEGKRIEKLSRNMMELVFLEHHSFELKPYDIGGIIKEAALRFETAAEQAGIRLHCILPQDPAEVAGERELLLTLLANLLDNARKASAEGGNLWLRSRKETGQVIVEIEDEGKGIPEEDRTRVFESFYMADKVRNSKNNGVGLGLSICADIVKIHNARIELDSKLKKGTLVKIIFPCYKQDTNKPYYEIEACRTYLK